MAGLTCLAELAGFPSVHSPFALAASQVTHEQFRTLMRATYGQVVRGLAVTPGTPLTDGNTTSPRPPHPQVPQGPFADREQR